MNNHALRSFYAPNQIDTQGSFREVAHVRQRSEVREEIGAGMVGSSAAMRELRERIGQIAATGETVLITGESGTGK